MYEAFGNYSAIIHPDLRGVNPIFNEIQLIKDYPDYNDVLGSLNKGASIHKQVRKFLQPHLKPGIKLVDIAKLIEMKTIELSNQTKSINKGIGFPVGLALNNCAAHYHPSSSDNTVFSKDDIIKIDYGTEVNGFIIDSAFTVCFNDKFDPLMRAVKEATETGITNAGIDVDIGDWAISIQEVMESHEIILDGKTYPIKAISNLGGHNITRGIIHGGTFLPCVSMKHKLPPNYRFKEGVYAIETFGSTGTSETVSQDNLCTLYRLNQDKLNQMNTIKLDSTKKLCQRIKGAFDTLPFCDRYIELFNINNFKSHLNILTNSNFINAYPPLYTNEGSYTAQYEHTIYLNESGKHIVSRGEDY
jgi:methionyl aminopeptidase